MDHLSLSLNFTPLQVELCFHGDICLHNTCIPPMHLLNVETGYFHFLKLSVNFISIRLFQFVLYRSFVQRFPLLTVTGPIPFQTDIKIVNFSLCY